MNRFLSSRLAHLCALALLVLAAVLSGHSAALAGLVLPMGATTGTNHIQGLMKVIYSDPLLEDIVKDSEIVSLFKTDMNVKSEETTGGKYVEMAHYLRLAGSAGARAEHDYMPISQHPRSVSSRIFLRKIMGVIEMTGDVMEKVTGDEGSFLNYMERALPDTKERVVTELDRMYIGYGAGIKARLLSKPAANTIRVNRSLGVTGYEDAWLMFQEGETIVASSTAAGTAIRNAGSTQSGLVESIDETTGDLLLTIDATTYGAWAVDDYLFAGDAAGVSSQDAGVDREVAGLLAGVDNGSILATYNNVARTGNRHWNARVFDASGPPYNGEVTEDLLVILDAMTSVVGNSKIDVLVFNPHAPIGYWQDMKADRTLNDPRSYSGGKGALSVMLGDRSIPFRTARKLPPQIAFGLNSSTWRRFTLNQWEWVARQGSIWNLVTDGTGRKDAYFAFGKMYEQLACLFPRRNFRIEGLVRKFNF